MGGALRNALMGGLGTTLVVAGLVGLPSIPAAAVSTARPVAVAVADDGTSYAGYASGGRLLRLDRSGNPAGSVPLDRDGPVTALDVSSDGHIWVYYGATVTELTPSGDVVTAFSTLPGGNCPVNRAHDPARYGGIDVYGSTVYVAGRCSGTVRMYSRDGDLQGTLDLPGATYPGDVVSAPGVKGLPARTYVSLPDVGKVYAYNTAGLRNRPKPAKTLTIKKFFGYRTPAPAALAADEKGQLAVVDVENNAVHFYNGPENYWYYRTLGHPPDPASDRGFLDRPTAFDNADGSFKKGFWIADSENGRIQHWDHIGTTDWMTDAMPPGAPGAPDNLELPRITGTAAQGSTLGCDLGSWTGAPASYDVAWLRDGLPIGGARDLDYTVVAADVKSELTCTVTAIGADGARSAPAASEGFAIPGANSPPYLGTAPVVRGEATPGSVLRCSTGSWTGPEPSYYLRGWLRDGQLLPGTNAFEYRVTDNDVYHDLTCRVAAVNRYGTSKAALSEPVLAETGRGNSVRQPESVQRPKIIGRAAVGSVLYCEPGKWDGAPTFTYVWRRDGNPIGGSEKDRYEVLWEDKGRQLTCVVTGSNTAGSDRGTSAPVRPRRR